jgi:SNF2 family DNA or RNA helicase
MLILHASWLAASGAEPAGLALWGETDQAEKSPKSRGRRAISRPAAHPFSASAEVLQSVLPRAELKSGTRTAVLVARLPSAGGEPQPSRPFLRETASAATKVSLTPWEVSALIFTPADALDLLINLQEAAGTGLVLGADAAFWTSAARFVFELLAGQRYLPTLVEDEAGWRALWRPVVEAGDDQAKLEKLAGNMPPAARAVGREAAEPEPGPRALLDNFVGVGLDAFVRQTADFGPPRKNKAHPGPGEQWLDALVDADPSVTLPAAFLDQYRAWSQPASAGSGNFRLSFRLDPPETEADIELYIPPANAKNWSLRYFLQPTSDLSLLVPAKTVWRERGQALRFLNRTFDQPQEGMLAGLGLAARMFAPIEASLRQARPEACELTPAQAHAFIREAALLLQGAGFGVLLPGLSTKLGVRLKLGAKAKRESRKGPQGGVAKLGFDSTIAFDWELALGDQPLSREEFDRLAALKVPLVQIRGQWVELRPEQMQQALDFLRKREKAGDIPLDEALHLALAPGEIGGLPVTGVEAEGWVSELLALMSDQRQLAPLPLPAGFVGALRPYQVTGVAWLAFLRQYGLGACLADDMGLGKTIQTIALLLHQSANGGGARKPSLLVCPTSVVGNWQHEVARFGPSLRVLVHHGGTRERKDLARLAGEHDLVLTTYALLPRDREALAGIAWDSVILDEAQNIKNPETRQAQAARELTARHRIALTGTPVENRLAELWSLLNFLNPGYLGSQESFRANYARPIERTQDPEAARRLKALVGPFILRRVKTDPTVINDLPAKNEMKVFCTLTREQATLYAAVVRDSLRQIEEAEGIQRRGLVLATLLKLKQVTNHPAQFLGDGSALPDRSGKLSRLAAMLEEVRAVNERALIFTQFSEMGHLLKAYLQSAFGDEVLFLYGGTPAKARSAMVERFQTEAHGPFAFVLSIKAGGTGLNLTRANHVFHFDRWWNPAVENQATDRAFRIGQTQNVQVHKFICAGTVEERIDEMIERKLALAQSIVGTSEAWITELSTDQLRDLFKLRAEAME